MHKDAMIKCDAWTPTNEHDDTALGSVANTSPSSSLGQGRDLSNPPATSKNGSDSGQIIQIGSAMTCQRREVEPERSAPIRTSDPACSAGVNGQSGTTSTATRATTRQTTSSCYAANATCAKTEGSSNSATLLSPITPRQSPLPPGLKPYYADEASGIYIICGDCREVLPELETGSIDCIFTDPPYGHNNNNGDLIHRREAALGRLPSGGDSPHGRPIANDGPEANELVKWAFGEWARVLKPGCCCCCCCGGGGPDPQFARWSLWLDEVLEFKQMIVWDKGPMGMGWHYRRSYETVLVAQKRGAACKWYDKSNRIENVIRPGCNGIEKIIPQENDHPTPKPIGLAMHFIRLHAEPGDLVLDPFTGGGSTLEAAKMCGCRAIGIELEERYCEIAARRLSQGVLFGMPAPAEDRRAS